MACVICSEVIIDLDKPNDYAKMKEKRFAGINKANKERNLNTERSKDSSFQDYVHQCGSVPARHTE